jgi:hypothetical protein
VEIRPELASFLVHAMFILVSQAVRATLPTWIWRME